MKDHHRRVAVFLCAFLPLLTVGCGDDDQGTEPDPTNNPTNNEPGSPQGVRVFYAPVSPATVSVVFKSDDPAIEEVTLAPIVAYTPTAYQTLAPSVYRALLFDAAGAPTGVTVESIPVEATSTTTLVVAQGESGNVRKQIISDAATTPSENHAKLRFLYQATGAAVDIYSMVNAERIGTSMEQGEMIPHAEYPIGTYSFEVRPEGLDDVALAITDVPLPPGQVVTVFVYGDLVSGLDYATAVDFGF